MSLKSDQAVSCRRRCTIGPILPDQGPVTDTPRAKEECIRFSPETSPCLPLGEKQTSPETGNFSADAPEHSHEVSDKRPDSESPMKETEKLYLWSRAPDSFGLPSETDSSGKGATRQRAASPSDALMHSLGDVGMRSAMLPPAFVSQYDWLRHLLLQAIEDAQLLFSSLWEECSCSTLGLPSKTCSNTRSAGVLDPAIAFAISGPSAPKRRLGKEEQEPFTEAGEPSIVSTHGTQEETQRSLQRENQAKEVEDTDSNCSVAGSTEEDTNNGKTQARPTAREYISAAMSWATKQLDDPRLFPPSPTASGSSDIDLTEESRSGEALRSVASLMVRRMLRCYAHVYLWHLPLLQQYGAVGHANRCLKRLMFLAVDAQLLDKDEGPLEPLRSLADAWLRHDQTNPSDRTSQEEPDDVSSQAKNPPGDWLVPALEKAEMCLGALDGEEYPFFGTNPPVVKHPEPSGAHHELATV